MNITFYGLESCVREWRAVVVQETGATCAEPRTRKQRWCFDAHLTSEQRDQLHASHWCAKAPGSDMPWNWRIGFLEANS